MDKIYYNRSLKLRAQELRREATIHENRLWYEFLKKHPRQFRRQKQFGRYIVDFYCAQAKLVIELDGSQHYESAGQISDLKRDAELRNLGLTILRYSNADINRHFDAVCQDILQHIGL